MESDPVNKGNQGLRWKRILIRAALVLVALCVVVSYDFSSLALKQWERFGSSGDTTTAFITTTGPHVWLASADHSEGEALVRGPVRTDFSPGRGEIEDGNIGPASSGHLELEVQVEQEVEKDEEDEEDAVVFSFKHIRRKPRVAICLVGGARAFELSWPTIKKYVLDVYPEADVFLHSPLDKDAHKFTVLSGTKHLAAARIFETKYMRQSQVPPGLLTPSNSPNGIQGLLQYFSLVEGCINLIEGHEARLGMRYDWIMRTRVDTYWNGPLQPLSSFDEASYTVPFGSSFGGLNDRFGIGTWRTSRAALSRLSMLPLLHAHGYSKLNSETAFKLQLVVSNISYHLQEFPFCVLSKRRYPWPVGVGGVPVASILSRGPLNGAKCRPCTPLLTGSPAKAMADHVGKGGGWIGPSSDFQLCNATDDWDSNWERVFEEAVGPTLSSRYERHKVYNRSTEECVEELEVLKARWESWDAPPALQICSAAASSPHASISASTLPRTIFRR